MTHQAPTHHRLVAMQALVAMALTCSATPVHAYHLRSPQVVFQSAPLQSLMDNWDGHINVLTDQLFGQGLTVNTGSCVHSYVAVLSVDGGASIGVYNTQTVMGPPTLCELFPAEARRGWEVGFEFLPSGAFRATLYDESFQLQRTTTYTGLDRDHIGFYESTAAGVGYIEDGRNANTPRVLLFAGTQGGGNFGDYFLCFENADYNPATTTFTGELVRFDRSSECETLVRNSTWGGLKSAYR